MKKIDLTTLLIVFLFSIIMMPYSTLANSEEFVGKDAILTQLEEDGIEVYENIDDELSKDTLPDKTEISVLEEDESYSLIQYKEDIEDDKDVDEVGEEEGYVKNEHIIFEDEFTDKEDGTESNAEETEENNGDKTTSDNSESKEVSETERDNESDNSGEDDKSEEDESTDKESTTQKAKSAETHEAYAQKKTTNVYADTSRNSSVLKSYYAGKLLKYKDYNDSWYKATVKVGGKWESGYIHKDDVGSDIPTFTDYAQQEKTKVYADTSKSSNVLKTYPLGSMLKYKGHSASWYEVTVKIKGKWRTGYIHKDDVGSDKPSLGGYAQKKTTNVYADTSKSSSILKDYYAGKQLKYKAYNGTWYEATVKVDGKWEKGYIHKDDVGSDKPTFKDYAQKKNTNVYAKTSRSSSVIKKYEAGKLLKYTAYNSTWFQAKVKVNGKYQTGYIHKDDVGSEQPTFEGYAQNLTTNVYSKTSKSSSVLKKYTAGKLLKYKAYNNSWYEAKVKVNGKYVTGFIHKKDVGSKEPTFKQYAQKETTNIYASTSKKSKVLKTYPAGQELKFKGHNGTWYKATVKVGSKWLTGYIHKNDVSSKKPSFTGYAQLAKTSVYSTTSLTSKTLKSYDAGSVLKYRPYNDQWYEATVILKGKKQTGYIYKDHVGDNLPTLRGFASKKTTNVYSKTSKSSSVLKSYKEGHLLKFKPHSANWYKATVKVGDSWQTGYIHKNDVMSSTGKTVVIDAGHGGSDPGTSGNGIVEKNLALELAKETKRQLEQAGFKVIMTRSTDEFIELKERTDIANKSNSHLFLSIHANSGGGEGIETWWYSGGPKPNESKKFADDVQSEVIKETNARDRGTKDGNLHVNRESNMPSALIEVGFVDNKKDADKLKKESYKKGIVKGIVNGIKKYFKIP